MRALTVLLLFLGACGPAEEPCLLLASGLTEGEAAQWVAGSIVLLSNSPECSGAGVCIRDRTVSPGKPEGAPMGYCAGPCELGCPPGTQCREVDRRAFCLH